RLVRQIASLELKLTHRLLWSVLGILLLILGATSPHVNWTVLTLHADALALLTSMVFWWALLEYAREPVMKRLLILALMPAMGFAVKPFLLAWIPVTVIVLTLLPFSDRKRHVSMCCVYIVVASVTTLALIGLFYMWWGHDFIFWVFEVTGGSRKRITL